MRDWSAKNFSFLKSISGHLPCLNSGSDDLLGDTTPLLDLTHDLVHLLALCTVLHSASVAGGDAAIELVGYSADDLPKSITDCLLYFLQIQSKPRVAIAQTASATAILVTG